MPGVKAWPYHGERARVVVAGGGVAALEGALALRAFVADVDVAITLLALERRFRFRPLDILEPFEHGAWSLDLERFGADQDIEIRHDGLASVSPGERRVVATSGTEHRYDVLLVAVGARAMPAIPGAVLFAGAGDAAAVRTVLEAAVADGDLSIAFAAPPGPTWTLPIYELALRSAAELRVRGAHNRVRLVTPEPAPLAVFGHEASAFVSGLLEAEGIELVANAEADSAKAGVLLLRDGRSVAADRVVALPRLAGRRIPGLPADDDGFICADAHGAVEGLRRVYAAGDATSFPLKHGGLATEQADAAAEAMLADLGLPIAPRPVNAVVRGVLYTTQDPAYLQAPVAGTAAPIVAPSPHSLWWPPSKIAARFLAPYLTMRCGAPRAPEVRLASDLLGGRADTT